MQSRTLAPSRRASLSPAILAVLSLTLLRWGSWQKRELTFEERVKAQEAIERVYYSHQIGVTESFDEVVPRAVLEKKVHTYLKESVALETFWRTPITTAALERELQRIASGTRLPDRLQEIYKALGYDPLLIAEALARPVLVDRLARNFFASDQRIHATARKEAEDLRRRLESGVVDVSAEHPNRQVLEVIRREHFSVVNGDSPAAATRQVAYDFPGQPLELSSEEFGRWRAHAPRTVGEIGPLVEEPDAFVMRVVLDETSDSTRLAVYTVPKTGWEAWWAGVADEFEEASVKPVAGSLGQLPATSSSSSWGSYVGSGMPTAAEGVGATSPTCIPDDTWDNGILDDLPKPRYDHTAVWTGNLMIVWGGLPFDGSVQGTGARYDPLTDTWAAASAINTPAARYAHTAIWTGAVMVVWGGAGAGNLPLATGGRYDPLRDSWEPTSLAGAPESRVFHTAVWTGSEMIVWGGTRDKPVLNSGGRYDPATDTWRSTSTAGAPSPRSRHRAIWTGSRMIVWGGYDDINTLNTGGGYDPGLDTWTPTSTVGAPSPRVAHTSVWTGTEMIVWGGTDYTNALNTGGRYDPASDSWAATSTIGAPSERGAHTAVWTGREMIIWGGLELFIDFEPALDTGARYDPASDSWVPTSMTTAPSWRGNHTAVWTGSQMIVWGGHSDVSMGNIEAVFNTGGRYDPAGDSWTPTSVLSTPAGSLCCHTAVWTGNLMIVWGGRDETSFPVNTGARYDLLTDAWTPTSRINAPARRDSHQAVWTGSEMIVWGGARSDGGRYDPVSDAWRSMSTAGAPSPRFLRTPAIWTGSEMIVWGGLVTTTTATDTGGRYDPVTDRWSATSTAGAPSPRVDHTAVWTGSEVIVWGGDAPFQGFFNTGGRYNPVADAWRPVSLSGAPSGRYLHSAIWTGSLMIVWGGSGQTFLSTGGRYDPATDTWTPTSTVNAPAGRYRHTAIWTGRRMIIWGGSGGGNTGGLYDPAADSWTPTSTSNAPSYSASSGHTAVWTGGFMIVWGSNWGGRYALEQAVDNDADGLSDCGGDCDDTNPLVWSRPVEVSNLLVLATNPPSLNWDDQGSLAGWGTQYDLVSGALFASGLVDLASGTCLWSGTATTYEDARPDPETGRGLWYLVRARNSCGLGPYGSSLRDASVAPCP